MKVITLNSRNYAYRYQGMCWAVEMTPQQGLVWLDWINANNVKSYIHNTGKSDNIYDGKFWICFRYKEDLVAAKLVGLLK